MMRMRAFQPGRLFILAAGGFTLVLLMAGCGSSRDVEPVSPHRGEIRESFSEPARTRLKKSYSIVMPVDGRIGRIDLEPGDTVKTGQSLVEFDRKPLQLEVDEAAAAVEELQSQITLNEFDRIEETALVETKATVDAASETLKAADAQVAAERARSDRSAKELDRTEKLFAQGTATQRALDDARLDADTTLIELRKQEFVRAALNAIFTAVKLGPKYIAQWLSRKRLQRTVLYHQLDQAKARLTRAQYNLHLAAILSPIDGVVLKRYEEGDGPFTAGHALLLLGSLSDLEVVADVLTQDAMRLAPGARVDLECAACPKPISGSVTRIEPAGFTKLSSLGVEQQRVNVIVSLGEKPPTLGVGFRLQARFYTATRKDALIVPRFSVLQSPGGEYYVFVIQDGHLKRTAVELGLRNDLEMEITKGLNDSDRIVSTPDATMKDGESVRVQRQASE